MSITITAERMTSDRTAHWAAPTAAGREFGTWTVSWLPDRTITRNQALTAMTLAELVAAHNPRAGHRWAHVCTWAAELDLDSEHAVRLATRIPPTTTQPAVPEPGERSGPADPLPAAVLVDRWETTHGRVQTATQRGTTATPRDHLTTLELGARIARLVTAGRWATVTALLRSGGVDSWSQIAAALGLPESTARISYTAWLGAQVRLFRATGRGLSPAEGADLAALVQVMSW